jgi:hypothetical protein
MDFQSPLRVLSPKLSQFQGKLFTSSFLQAAVVVPILGIDFFRKFKITVDPETNSILFACALRTSAQLSCPPALPGTSDRSPLPHRWCENYR